MTLITLIKGFFLVSTFCVLGGVYFIFAFPERIEEMEDQP